MWTAEFYAGVAARLAPTLRERRELLDPDIAATIEQALAMDAEAYGRAVQMRYAFRESTRRFFDDYDLLLSPTLPVASVDVGVNIPARFADRNLVTWVGYTYPFNLTGQPAASIPAGFTRKMTCLRPPQPSRRRGRGHKISLRWNRARERCNARTRLPDMCVNRVTRGQPTPQPWIVSVG